jgi:hypothetical protein
MALLEDTRAVRFLLLVAYTHARSIPLFTIEDVSVSIVYCRDGGSLEA